MNNNIDAKIEKICKEIEKDFKAEVVKGKAYRTEEKTTIPVSIKKSVAKNQNSSPYSLPVGLIQITGSRVEFVPIEQKSFLIKTIIKIIVIILGVVGLKSLFSSKKKWDTE